ncbi:gibberellin 20 oxidase 1-b [Phtheirospermum japonicum]|uniref:Gibberellin 20 oxidase 1-b n=1 Tax=Phtheirospermum japonicum TaxID=374723 RepID=A0A830BS42_9LAMI|nr:gibberellin 20 oxidase 1-b [Phtheirospermum japonicum]
MSLELPVFDISQPFDSFSLSSLSQACREWGFFHITNHGISDDLCRKMQILSSRIFTLPLEVKNKAGPLSDVKTYTPHFIASPFYESLRVSGPDFFGSAQGSSEALMSQPNSEFSEILQEYGSTMTRLSKTILETVIKCLGTDIESKYLLEFKNCHGYMRINNYSPTETIDNHQETEGLGMHTDMSCITIVYQDEIGGLQVRSKEGQWMDINPRENTFVVNIGDLLHAWTNGEFRSSEHRVVLRKNVPSRFSVAFFWCFEDEKVIFAPEEVVGDFRVYKAFVCGDYVRFRENSEKGKFEKVGFNVKHFAGTDM